MGTYPQRGKVRVRVRVGGLLVGSKLGGGTKGKTCLLLLLLRHTRKGFTNGKHL